MRLVVVLCLCLGLGGVEALDAVTSVPYRGSQIQVWRERDRYFLSPLAHLINNSATVQQNIFTNNVQLDFQIGLTSLDSKQVVHSHLKNYVNSSILLEHVQLLPLEKVRLVWKAGNPPPSSDYRVLEAWQSSSDSPAVVTFHIWCRSLDKCGVLRDVITSQPEMLYALEVEYIVASPVTTRLVTVAGDRLRQTELYARMLGMPARRNLASWYLTERDVTDLASQTAAAAAVADYVDASEESTISSRLLVVLKQRPVWTRDFTNWSSVYWEPGHSRPDRVALFLNTVLALDRNDSQSFLVDERRVDADTRDTAACASELGISRTILTNKTGHRVKKETVFSALRGKHNVEWDSGERRFRVKPFVLYEVNLPSLVGSEELARSYVRARRYTHVQSVKVRSNIQNETVHVSLERVQARVDEQLRLLADGIGTNLTQQTTLVRTKLSDQTNSVERSLERSRNMLNETLRSLGNAFTSWPGYCRRSGVYCNSPWTTGTNYPRPSARTYTECRAACEQLPRCLSFNFVTNKSPRCRLFHFVCPHKEFEDSSTGDYYVKLSRIPLINTDMWRSAFSSSDLGDITTNPCGLLGQYHPYSSVV